MRALVYHGPRQMRWEEWPMRTPEAGEVTLRVDAVGICGSDLHGYAGESGRRVPPMVMGHEATGTVIELGNGVDSDWLNRRVILQPFVACGVCDPCRTGATNLCRNRRFFGGNMHGAMVEQLTLPVDNILPLPPGVKPEHGVLAEPLAVGLHAVKQAGDIRGKSVLIAGCGPIGLLTLVAARQSEAGRIVVLDVNWHRLQAAMALGADAALDVSLDAAGGAGGTMDVAFDAVGISATFAQALAAVRPAGTVIAIGGWQTVSVDLAAVVTREVTVRGTFNFTPDDFEAARQLLAARAFDMDCLVTDVYPLADGPEVFAKLAQSQGNSIKVALVAKAVAQ